MCDNKSRLTGTQIFNIHILSKPVGRLYAVEVNIYTEENFLAISIPVQLNSVQTFEAGILKNLSVFLLLE